jgi:hypothetical protein
LFNVRGVVRGDRMRGDRAITTRRLRCAVGSTLFFIRPILGLSAVVDDKHGIVIIRAIVFASFFRVAVLVSLLRGCQCGETTSLCLGGPNAGVIKGQGRMCTELCQAIIVGDVRVHERRTVGPGRAVIVFSISSGPATRGGRSELSVAHFGCEMFRGLIAAAKKGGCLLRSEKWHHQVKGGMITCEGCLVAGTRPADIFLTPETGATRERRRS